MTVHREETRINMVINFKGRSLSIYFVDVKGNASNQTIFLCKFMSLDRNTQKSPKLSNVI